MNTQDNFDQSLDYITKAFCLVSGGHYEPKSTRDYILSCHLKHTLDTILSPAFERLVEQEERKIEAERWVREMIPR